MNIRNEVQKGYFLEDFFRFQDHYDQCNTGNGVFTDDDQNCRCKHKAAVVFNYRTFIASEGNLEQTSAFKLREGASKKRMEGRINWGKESEEEKAAERGRNWSKRGDGVGSEQEPDEGRDGGHRTERMK